MSEKYRILLVEDDAIDRMAFERFVKSQALNYDYQIAASLAQAYELLASHTFDIALVDYSLGDGTGMELVTSVRQLPIVMITGSSGLPIAVEAMKSGAFDFIVKDPQGDYLTTLPITVETSIERWQAQQELVRYRTYLEQVITERTAAWIEEQLRLQTVVEATLTIVFSLSPEGRFRFIAGNTRDILGQSPEELISKSLFDFLDEPSKITFGFEKALSGENFVADMQLRDRWLNISLALRSASSDEPDMIGVLHDITDRKLAEMAVMQERNLLRTLIDNIPDYIFVKDEQGRFVESNDAHSAGARTSREKVINHTAAEIFDPTVAAQFHADDELVLKDGRSIINEERITTSKDGEARYVLTTKVPLYDRSGEVITGLVGISRDITERRQAEQERIEMERMRIEFEHERELVDLKQRFIETASHNFRTPLTIIKSSASLLETYGDRITSERQQIKLQQIQNQVDHMVWLLNDVLTLSKLNAGKIELNSTVVDLKTFTERTWEDLVAISEVQHLLHFAFDTDVKTLIADENLLQQILVNLLSNAFKYTPAGCNISFRVSSDDEDVIFEVRDEGIGIPEADQKHLFEPFHRGANVKNIEGTGLGLVITKDYIALQGGTIHVKSEEDSGTCMTVRLPKIPHSIQ